jgi:hypothetical protein
MTHINQRRDTASNWTSANPVLHLGEVGWETDTRKAKLGDGVNAWNDLPYATRPINAVGDVPGLQTELDDINADIAATNAVVASKAPIASPTFTGDPKAPTPATADNDTSIATTAYVKANLASYATLASPTFTGDPKAPTPSTADNDTSIATTAFVKAQAYAPLASPTFTGDPKAPTPATSDNDTSIATTAYVKAQNYVTGDAAGRRISGAFSANSGSLTPGSEATITVTHSLGVTPLAPMAAYLQDGAFAHQVGWRVSSMTTTQIQFVFKNNGAANNATAILNFRLLY